MLRLALLITLLMAPCARAAEESQAWKLMKSLAGDWDSATSEGKAMPVSYQVVSNGSAVMETVKAPDGGPFMITMYHRDGDDLLATHYCAMGNQPRMRAKPADMGKDKIAFRFLDVTNLSGPGEVHITDVTINFTDANHVVSEWRSLGGGKNETTVFKLTRKK